MTQAERRIVERAQAVLEAGFQHMLEHDGNLPTDYESQLERALGRGKSPLGYQELKQRMPAIAKHPKYIYVAVRFMENTKGGAIVIANDICREYKLFLSRIFGSKAILETPESLEEARKAFWSHWPNEWNGDEEE